MILFKRKKRISFKEAIDLTGFPIITFKSKTKTFNFLIDTGSNCSVIDERVVHKIEGNKTGEKATLAGLDGIERKVEFFKAILYYEDKELIEDFQITDLSMPFGSIKKEHGVTLHGILGSTFFIKYKSLIDFNKLNILI